MTSEGDFLHGQRCGQGCLHVTPHMDCEGEFKDNLRNGEKICFDGSMNSNGRFAIYIDDQDRGHLPEAKSEAFAFRFAWMWKRLPKQGRYGEGAIVGCRASQKRI